MNTQAIEYRRLRAFEEYLDCERLQQAIWGFADLSVVPAHILVTFQKRGGIVLGAFDGGRLIGFVYGFVGHDGGRSTHNSVMSAVCPEYRNRGVALRLKLEQRRLALAQGFSLMTWTFDPLQALNAHFNLNKLGAVCRGYERNLYGEFRDQLNRGLPTDRFEVEWWLDCARTAARVETPPHAAAPAAGAPPPAADNAPRPGPSGLVPDDGPPRVGGRDELHLAIPLSVDQLKAQDPELALRWRLHLRAWLEAAFEAGFTVRGFDTDRERRIGYYRLSRAPLSEILKEAR